MESVYLYPVIKNFLVNMKFIKSYKEFINESLILEGGSYGHLNHPFEDYSLTFRDLKQIVNRALGGYLNKEEEIRVKANSKS